ncbi:MAG: hypothetical protein CMJ18_28220 [Phycisphaeraceae bacterium]|nr:hypothetical protein [Phycisphaeraceae bacterium]
MSTDVPDIEYIKPEAPPFDFPAFRGQRFEALVPDTLDLADSAARAVHVMTENPGPETDYEPYWSVNFVPVPFMSCDFVSASITPKFQEAVCLDRIMSGSEQNLHVDRRWMELTLRRQGPHGLIYTPTKGRPWAMRFKPGHYASSDEIAADNGQWLCPFSNGQLLRTMSLYAARDGGSLWPRVVREVADGMIELGVDAGEYAYYWPGPFYARRDHPRDVRPVYQYHMVEMSQISLGLTVAHRQVDYEPALDFAGKLIEFQRRTFFRPDGTHVTSQPGAIKSHVHGHARGLHSMADYAMLRDDHELLEFVARSYAWTRSAMDPLTGFTPNIIPSPPWTEPVIPGEMDPGRHSSFVNMDEYNGCEVAGLTDMIAIALWLTEAGVMDGWDDVDRWTRNMLCGSQLRQIDWVDQLPGMIGHVLDAERGDMIAKGGIQLMPGQTTDRVMERNLGAWPTGAAPNDFCHDESGDFGYGLVHGDTATAGRVLYYIWRRMLTCDGGHLRVNLLLNRASKWADVDSFIPFQGRVEIWVRQPVRLSVRLAEWTNPRDVRVTVNGEDRDAPVQQRYAEIGDVRPDDHVVMTFPIAETHDVVHIEKKRYALIRRGNDVVSIHPRGRYYPFYQRDHDRTDEPRYRRVSRFVAEDEVVW